MQIQVIIGFGYVVISGSIAQFYWSGGNVKTMGKHPIILSVRNTLKYNMGKQCDCT